MPHNHVAKTIISLVNQGQSSQAILEFHKLHRTGFKVTVSLLTVIAKACGTHGALTEGKQAHCVALKQGFNRDKILMTSLMDMYSKCYNVQDARMMFAEMPQRDIVSTNSMISGLCRCNSISEAIELFNSMRERDVGSWNSLISGLAQNSEGRTALLVFDSMRLEGFEFDVMTMTSVLSVCADLAALSSGKEVHGLVVKCGFELFVPVGNALVDMYGKCGRVNDAYRCFESMRCRNVISWTSLILGYGKHGLGLEAVRAFDQMEMEGVLPNKITFLGVLYACSHAGLVQEGFRIFDSMVKKFSFTPTMEHYTCMVDLLGRSGRLMEAYCFIERMPIKPEAKLLTAFFSSCCYHKNIELAKNVGQRLLQLEPEEAGAYMLLSNFYGLIGDMEGVANVRRSMLNKGIKKVKARTWIQIDRNVHSFESGDRSHPLSKDIYNYLQKLFKKLKSIGYVPNTSMVMQNVDVQTKEELVLGHSEKLAIALGLISTPPATPIMIVKNLRVCVDCHEVTRLISEIEGREIVARDSSRFHHFKNGVCCCGNHW